MEMLFVSVWKTSDIVVFVIEQHIPGFFTAAYSEIIEYFLFPSFLFSSSAYCWTHSLDNHQSVDTVQIYSELAALLKKRKKLKKKYWNFQRQINRKESVLDCRHEESLEVILDPGFLLQITKVFVFTFADPCSETNIPWKSFWILLNKSLQWKHLIFHIC